MCYSKKNWRKIMPNKNIQNALKPIMHRTYDSYDEIIKDIEKSIELTPDSVEVRIDDNGLNTEDYKALMMLLLSFEIENEIKVD